MSIEIAGVRKNFQTKMSVPNKAADTASGSSSSSSSLAGGLSGTTTAVSQNLQALFATPAHPNVQTQVEMTGSSSSSENSGGSSSSANASGMSSPRPTEYVEFLMAADMDEATKKILLGKYLESVAPTSVVKSGVIRSANIKDQKLLENFNSKAAVIAVRDNNLRLGAQGHDIPVQECVSQDLIHRIKAALIPGVPFDIFEKCKAVIFDTFIEKAQQLEDKAAGKIKVSAKDFKSKILRLEFTAEMMLNEEDFGAHMHKLLLIFTGEQIKDMSQASMIQLLTEMDDELLGVFRLLSASQRNELLEVVRPAGTVMEWFAMLRDHVWELQGKQASLDIWYPGPKGKMGAPSGGGGGKPVRWWTELFTGPPPTDAFLCRICGRWPRSRHDLNHTAATCHFVGKHPDANPDSTVPWAECDSGIAWLARGKFVLPAFESLDPSRRAEILPHKEAGDGQGGAFRGQGGRGGRHDHQRATPYEPHHSGRGSRGGRGGF